MSSSQIHLALIQLKTYEKDPERTYQEFLKHAQTLQKPVDLIMLPEMWLSGFQLENSEEILQQTRHFIDALQKFAQTERTHVLGSCLEQEDGRFHNSAQLISPEGKITATYRKVHLFQMGDEDKKFHSGDRAVVASTDLGKLGLAICYDIRFPELLRAEILGGAQVLLIPSAWPKARIDHYLSLLKARAIENLVYVVSTNKVGKNPEGILYGGRSSVFDPWGNSLGEMDEHPGVLQVTIDLGEVEKIRGSFPVFKARREDVYSRPISDGKY